MSGVPKMIRGIILAANDLMIFRKTLGEANVLSMVERRTRVAVLCRASTSLAAIDNPIGRF